MNRYLKKNKNDSSKDKNNGADIVDINLETNNDGAKYSEDVINLNNNGDSNEDRDKNDGDVIDLSDDGDTNDSTERNNDKKKRYLQKARKGWLENQMFKNWIIISENDNSFVKCKYCNCQIQSKHSTLKYHAISKKHKLFAQPFEGLQKKIPFRSTNSVVSTSARITEARLALYIACHSAIHPIKHLVECDKENHKNDPVSLEISLGRTKCTAILKNIWGPYFKEQLILDIGNSPFSLIIDEATDISTSKYVGIVIKYYSKKRKEIATTFLSLELCEDSTAEGITAIITKVLNDFNLSVKNLSGLGTDNARVMVGINNSVHKKLQSLKSNQYLTLVPCACHSLQLAVTHAVSKCFPENLEFLANETYSWFSKSQKRQMHYKNIYKAINDGIDPLKITRACPTRWMSIEITLNRICDQWLELKTHFGIVLIHEKCYTAKILFDLYKDEKLFLLSTFLKSILSETQKVNKALQAKQSDPLKILNDLFFLVQAIAGKIYIQEKILELITQDVHDYEEYLLPQPYLGYGFENLLKEKINLNVISKEDELEIRRICVNFLKELVEELKNRLPKNIEILQKMYYFSIENTLKEIKEPITIILEVFKKSYNEIDKIQNQWENITKQHWDINMDTSTFWIQVYNFKNSVEENPFKELSEFVISLLVLPFSNADVERLFSTMGLVKNKIRNRMKTDLLCSILQIREGLKLESSCCYSFKIPDNFVFKIGSSEKYETLVTNEDNEEMENILFSLQSF